MLPNDESLGFFVRNIAHALYYMGEERLRALHITHQQGRLLLVIYQMNQRGSVMSRKTLENTMHLRGPTVTSLINGLEKHGYIARSVRADDGRAKTLVVTEKGLELVKTVRAVFQESEKQLLHSLTPRERDTILRLLGKVSHNLPDEIK